MSKGPKQLLRVVPSPVDASGYHKTQGTKVLMPDGTPIPAITGLSIHCPMDGVWEATITAHVVAPEVGVHADLVHDWPMPWWRRALLWLAGVREYDITDLGEPSFRKYAKFTLR